MNRKKGFTLIELLVVIAIIALLLAILMPGLQKAKEIAKNLVCRTNVRSLCTGFRLYAEQNNSKLFPKGSGGKHNLWLEVMASQIGDVDKVRYCPSTKKNPNEPPFDQWMPNQLFGKANLTWIWNFSSPDLERGSYGINGWLYENSGGDDNFWPNTNPPNSASVPVFADSVWVDGWPTASDRPAGDMDLSMGRSGGYMGRFITNRHGDGTNVGFVDGHVESVALERLWSLKWGKQFQTKPIQTRQDDSPIYQR